MFTVQSNSTRGGKGLTAAFSPTLFYFSFVSDCFTCAIVCSFRHANKLC